MPQTSVPQVPLPSVSRSDPEGSVTPGPYLIEEGWLPSSWGSNWNYWQMGYDPLPLGTNAMVEACVSAYAQTIAMCPGNHWLSREDGGRDRVTTSALYRILRKPNSYQTISDFLLNLGRSVYTHGEAFALALRNEREEIAELHLMDARSSGARVAPDGSIFYHLAGNEIVENYFRAASEEFPYLSYVPARDVLHVRLHTPRHPLKGESPLVAAAMSMATGNAMLRQQLTFYMNQARPSQVLTTDLILDKDQVNNLRDRWNEQSRGLSTGGTPILTAGLKPQTLSTAAEASQLADIMKLTDQQIALVYRTPLQILGIGGTPFASTEALMQSWLAGGLQFGLNHVETAFDALFRLRGNPDEYTELDISTLLRPAEKDRIESLTKSVSGGIRTINEARGKEDLPKVAGGDDIRVQQQDVPLDWHEQQLKLQKQKPAAPPPPPPSPPAAPAKKDDEDVGISTGALADTLLRSADEHDRSTA